VRSLVSTNAFLHAHRHRANPLRPSCLPRGVRATEVGVLPPCYYVPAQNRLDGHWHTSTSVVYIGPDVLTGRLAYNELRYDDVSSRLHGWLQPHAFAKGTLFWRAGVVKILSGESVWYGSSWGEPPPTFCLLDVSICAQQDAAADMLRLRRSTEADDELATRFFPDFLHSELDDATQAGRWPQAQK
jgi:hypothetical protein